MPRIPLVCPYCHCDLQIPDDVWYYTCEFCRESLDLKSQFAFLRGMEAFDEGQALMIKEGPRKPRSKTRDHAVYKQVLDLFTEAYSALQAAFMGRLEEVQRQVGVEMMASMSAEFFLQNMISPLELNYWSLILREQNTRTEIDRIKKNLARSDTSAKQNSVNPLTRIHGMIRTRQLKGKLLEMDQKISMVESQIAFVDTPRARNKSWKP